MAAPNLLTSTTVTGKTSLANLSTVTGNVITNSSGSNTVDKLNNIVISNYSNAVAYANVMINRSTSSYYVGANIAVPAYSTLVLLGKDTNIYLEEGDVLQANVSTNNTMSLSASYEIIG